MSKLLAYSEASLRGIVRIAMEDDDPSDMLDVLVSSLAEYDDDSDGMLILADYLARPDKMAAPGRYPQLAETLREQHSTRVVGSEDAVEAAARLLDPLAFDGPREGGYGEEAYQQAHQSALDTARAALDAAEAKLKEEPQDDGVTVRMPPVSVASEDVQVGGMPGAHEEPHPHATDPCAACGHFRTNHAQDGCHHTEIEDDTTHRCPCRQFVSSRVERHRRETIILMCPKGAYSPSVIQDADVVIDRDGIVIKNRNGLGGWVGTIHAGEEILKEARPVYPPGYEPAVPPALPRHPPHNDRVVGLIVLAAAVVAFGGALAGYLLTR